MLDQIFKRAWNTKFDLNWPIPVLKQETSKLQLKYWSKQPIIVFSLPLYVKKDTCGSKFKPFRYHTKYMVISLPATGFWIFQNTWYYVQLGMVIFSPLLPSFSFFPIYWKALYFCFHFSPKDKQTCPKMVQMMFWIEFAQLYQLNCLTF